MNATFKSFFARFDHLPAQFDELREGVKRAILVADLDAEMALTRCRKVLEFVLRDVYDRRIGEPPGTRPLENLLQRLVKDGHFPDRLDAYANTIRKLGNVGTHSFGENVTVEDVTQSLTQLMPILDWYLEIERAETIGLYSAETRLPPTQAAHGKSSEAPSSVAEPGQIVVVPKGLRSFDAGDTDFFLDLLPGPRDKAGLPDSIRFWKHRIEAQDEASFTVGVIYGPSGCGKSSLMKAGLLPHLAPHVLSVYVEATGADTEARLLKGLRKRCPDLAPTLDLTGALIALRQGQGLPAGHKIVLVVDQFEQWLHAKRGQENAELVQALRQCDGEHVQCVVMVRDDFWIGLSRFMEEIHVELLQGQNSYFIDLFDLRHTKKVFIAFGQAFGALAECPNSEQDEFLELITQSLAQDGRVIPVRLAVFAEMIKSRPWMPATWRQLGGMAGVGVAFLDETFSANNKNRLHQNAARNILKALLPEQGTNVSIKGNMRSRTQLRQISGYERQPKEFEEVMRNLDGELRLITPTDPEGMTEPAKIENAGEAYYQLTHDYLVHSLRDWLSRKQKESRRGRAELCLAERAAGWQHLQENRMLPSFREWAFIRLFTSKPTWTPPQAKMMRTATRHFQWNGLVVLSLIVAANLIGLFVRLKVVQHQKEMHAEALVQRLCDAETAQVPGIVAEMKEERAWTDPLLAEQYAGEVEDSRRKLHLGLGLLPVDPRQVDYLCGRLLTAPAQEISIIRDALQPFQMQVRERLWKVVKQAGPGQDHQVLCAACALAAFDPGAACWRGCGSAVVDRLLDRLQQNPGDYTPYLSLLAPARHQLLGPLGAAFRQPERSDSLRSFATNLLAEYAADQPAVLADLLMDAPTKQFTVLFPKVEAHGEKVAPVFHEVLARPLAAQKTAKDKEWLAKRQANAAAALLRLGKPEQVWPLLKHRPDPRVRSYLIQRLGLLGIEPKLAIKQLERETDVSIQRALLLCLGETTPAKLPENDRAGFLASMLEMHRTHADPGVHGAAEWLLRQWGAAGRLKANDAPLATGKIEGERNWYLTGQGQTMMVIAHPVEFVMGSPLTEEGRGAGENLHRLRIDRCFALGAKEVDVGSWQAFWRDAFPGTHFDWNKEYSPTDDHPINAITWYQTAHYCNWLSQKEGIAENQWCYRPNTAGKYDAGMTMAENYLQREGYRLPTEAEWEYGCRAGALTSRSYGETEELLSSYGWYLMNSHANRTLPGGTLMPNDFGLFDMLGNVDEWCLDKFADYPAEKAGRAREDEENVLDVTLGIQKLDNRVLRGGSFYALPRYVRSANRYRALPANRNNDRVGFRLARTLPCTGLSLYSTHDHRK